MKNAAELQEENAFLKAQLDEKIEKILQKDEYIVQLEQWLKHLRSKPFTPSSEKVAPAQQALFNEAEEIDAEENTAGNDGAVETITVATHQRKARPRVSLPEHLPREEVIHDLPEAEKICPYDGSALELIGSDDSEQLEFIPAQLKVLLHKRLKYACPCCEQHLATAAKPKQPIEKSLAGPGLLAAIATQKYCDALPLYRQSELFKRMGIALDRTNLANWMIKCGALSQPLINLLHEKLLEQPVIHMDETPVQVLNEPGKTAQSQSYMWVQASSGEQPVRLFHYAPTRAQAVPRERLTEQTQAIMTDGYEGYGKACDDYQITRLGCWAHARRKFVDAQKLQPKGKTGKADQALTFIQKLYRIEAEMKDQPPNERHNVRQQQARPIIDKLHDWLQKGLPNVPPHSVLGKALTYLHNQWPRLIRYLDDGHYPIDNNLAENAIRPFAIGRKNWLFSNSQAGARASANLYSIIETAKANGLNPYHYLLKVFTDLPNAQTLGDVEALLPWGVTLPAE